MVFYEKDSSFSYNRLNEKDVERILSNYFNTDKLIVREENIEIAINLTDELMLKIRTFDKRVPLDEAEISARNGGSTDVGNLKDGFILYLDYKNEIKDTTKQIIDKFLSNIPISISFDGKKVAMYINRSGGEMSYDEFINYNGFMLSDNEMNIIKENHHSLGILGIISVNGDFSSCSNSHLNIVEKQMIDINKLTKCRLDKHFNSVEELIMNINNFKNTIRINEVCEVYEGYLDWLTDLTYFRYLDLDVQLIENQNGMIKFKIIEGKANKDINDKVIKGLFNGQKELIDNIEKLKDMIYNMSCEFNESIIKPISINKDLYNYFKEHDEDNVNIDDLIKFLNNDEYIIISDGEEFVVRSDSGIVLAMQNDGDSWGAGGNITINGHNFEGIELDNYDNDYINELIGVFNDTVKNIKNGIIYDVSYSNVQKEIYNN